MRKLSNSTWKRLPDEAKKVKDIVDFVAKDFKVREALLNQNYEEIAERIVRCFKILRNSRRRPTFCKIVLPNNFDFDEVVSNVESIKDYVASWIFRRGSWISRIRG